MCFHWFYIFSNICSNNCCASEVFTKWHLCDSMQQNYKDLFEAHLLKSFDKLWKPLQNLLLVFFFYPLHWCLTYCFSYLSVFFPPLVSLCRCFLCTYWYPDPFAPLHRKIQYLHIFPASASVNMFSESHCCFFFLQKKNERLVIRLIILIHWDRRSPPAKEADFKTH